MLSVNLVAYYSVALINQIIQWQLWKMLFFFYKKVHRKMWTVGRFKKKKVANQTEADFVILTFPAPLPCHLKLVKTCITLAENPDKTTLSDFPLPLSPLKKATYFDSTINEILVFPASQFPFYMFHFKTKCLTLFWFRSLLSPSFTFYALLLWKENRL